MGTFTAEEQEAFSEGLREQSTGRYTFGMDGVQQFATLISIGINDWMLVSLIDHDAIDGYYHRSQYGAILIISTGSIILLFLIYWQIRGARKGRAELEHLAYTDLLCRGTCFLSH